MRFDSLMQASVQPKQRKALAFLSSPRGINTLAPSRELGPNELVTCTNFKLIPGPAQKGQLTTILASRPGLKKVTTATTNDKSIKHAAYIPIAGTYKFLLVDSDHKLYSCTGSEPTLDPGSSEKTLEGEATIVPFNDEAIILDGSYIKIWDGTSVELAYDDGSGTRARLYHSTCETLSDSKGRDLYSGATTRCGAKFTTPSWDAGYTIPLTRAKLWLSKTGSPTGTVSAKIYNADGSSLLATAETTLNPATQLTTSAKVFEFTWASDATQDMAASTAYIIAVEYSGGDASNYVTVHGYTEASGGDQYYYDGSWNNDATAGTAIDVYPSLPPKGKFGAVLGARLFVAGDPDYPGRLWFGNANSVLDWSTTDGGGYVSSVDYSSSAFPIGAIVSHFGQLLIFGKEEQPYLAVLQGANPSSYAIKPSWQQLWSTHKTALSLPNDVWFASGIGVQHLQGTESYGDLRSYPASDPVHDAVRDNWDTDAIVGYHPKDGQYILKLSGRTNLLACHVGLPGRPWTEYALANSVTPTCFLTAQNDLYLGGDDGNLYRFDESLHQDDSNDLTFALKTGIAEHPFGTMHYKLFYTDVGRNVTSYKLDFYTDGGSVDRTVDVSPEAAIQQGRVELTGDSLQVGMDTFVITGHFQVRNLLIDAVRLARRGR
jgi:hypothetical protein